MKLNFNEIGKKNLRNNQRMQCLNYALINNLMEYQDSAGAKGKADL